MTKEEYKDYLESRKEENEELLQNLSALSSVPTVASEVVIATLLTSIANDNIMKDLFILELYQEIKQFIS